MPEQISSYRLEGEIARGGMGIVYRALHTVFDEVVAIKAIFPELTLDPELRERFLNEAKIQRRLQHPNIVQIREFLIDHEKLYIVMEFVEGDTLTHRLRALGRPMLADEGTDIFRQALEGLGFAHSQGVIHRDVKPSNIMLTPQGVAKLTDFGIARALGSAQLTRTGMVRGTPAYMSPEQILGKKLDQRSDIYSMGVMFYEMLTGRVPFERPKDSDSEYPVITAHVNEPPTPPSHWAPGIPPFLETAILKALGKRPEQRFASCQQFSAAIATPSYPATRTVMVVSEPARAKAVKPAPIPGPSLLPTEPCSGPKRFPPIPAGRQIGSVEKLTSSSVGIVSLITAGVLAIALVLALLHRRNPGRPPGADYSAPPEVTSTLEQPETPAPAPILSVSQPMEVRQHTARAAELMRDRQYAGAASEYRAAIQLDPQNADLHVSLGTTLGLQGDWDGQIDEDREALRLNPSNDRAHTSLGMALSRKGNRDGAMAEYREAVRLNPNNEGAHTSLGIQYSQMGDWDGAIAEYSKVVRMRPNNYSIHYSLGMACEHKGDRQAAIQEYRTASELNPNIAVYKQAYDRLSPQVNR